MSRPNEENKQESAQTTHLYHEPWGYDGGKALC